MPSATIVNHMHLPSSKTSITTRRQKFKQQYCNYGTVCHPNSNDLTYPFSSSEMDWGLLCLGPWHFQSESGSDCVCWPTAASSALHLTTLLRKSDQSLAMEHVNTSNQLRRQPYWYHPRVTGLSVIGHSQWLPHGLETLYRNTFARAFSFHLPLRTEDRSVPVIVPRCDLTMYCALSARLSLSADLSPCTGCYKLFYWHCTVVLQQQCDNAI